jgi:Zn-dependent M32 family carboxypeptidase
MDKLKAHVRARTAADARWRQHRASKPLDKAVRELEEAVQNLQRKLQTVATVSDEPYESLIDGCLSDVASVLRDH